MKPIIIKTEEGDQSIDRYIKIGQLAIHRTWPTEDNPDEWTITHIQSGLFILRFTAIVSKTRALQLAKEFDRLNIDAYYAGGCEDKSFQHEVKRIYKRFMEFYGLRHTVTAEAGDQ